MVMPARQIIKIQMDTLKQGNDGIRVAYKFASPMNKSSTGPYKRFKNMVQNDLYKHLVGNKAWKFIPKSIDKTMYKYKAIVEVVSGFDQLKYRYKFTLSKQYDWGRKRPLYDRFEKMYLDGYWRTDSVELVQGGGNPLFNIYGEPLLACRSEGSSDMLGSWNHEGLCNETGGGVHQICVDVNKTPGFSSSTGQGDWSDGRKGKNHCMCLGAWALYKARQDLGEIPHTEDELKCSAIMDHALSEKYISKWNTWNGNEVPNQIVSGVNSLVEQCYRKGNTKQKQKLKQLYYNLTEDKPEFNKSIFRN